METNVRFKKLLRDFKESAPGIYIYLSFSKRDLYKLRLARTGKIALLGGTGKIALLAFVVQN